MITELTTMVESSLSIREAIVPLAFSVVASIVAYLMYQWFYGSDHIGAGVHRAFLIGGPAITVVFLVIRSSIPLGMGLLGTLALVRFRTPVKDPAEIGFLLLFIAASIGAATGNYLAVILLFLIAFIALSTQRLIRNRLTLAGRGHLMISVDRASFPALEEKLTAFLGTRLRGLSLESVSAMNDRVGLRYQYRQQPGFDWVAFTNELNQLAESAQVEIFVG